MEGGPALVVCDAGDVYGGFWTPDGKIVFADALVGLREVPATGGVSSTLPGIGPGNPAFGFPVLLQDGQHYLYQKGNSTSADLYVGSLYGQREQRNPKAILAGIVPGATYVPSPDDAHLGYLLFVRGSEPTVPSGTLMAQAFDLRRLNLVGGPVPLAQGVSAANFSASLNGTLAYGFGGAAGASNQLTLFDRQGKGFGTVGEPGYYSNVAFSPDGKRVVASRTNPQSGNANLWMMDLVRGIGTRFTFDSGNDFYPVWSPDGNRIAFASTRISGPGDLYQKLSNGGSEDELLFKSDYLVLPVSWSGDGRFLLFGGPTVTEPIISVLPMDANGHAAGKPFSFAQKGVGIEERFSPGPNGRPLWVAYSSHESGRWEIYVRPFDPNSPTGTPPGGGKWQVSTQGGLTPRWNGNGKELFYVALDGTVVSVEVSGTSTFQSGIPKPLFKPKGFGTQDVAANWDASSDGKKFIFPLSQSATATAPTKFTVVLNWPSLLKK